MPYTRSCTSENAYVHLGYTLDLAGNYKNTIQPAFCGWYCFWSLCGRSHWNINKLGVTSLHCPSCSVVAMYTVYCFKLQWVWTLEVGHSTYCTFIDIHIRYVPVCNTPHIYYGKVPLKSSTIRVYNTESQMYKMLILWSSGTNSKYNGARILGTFLTHLYYSR